MGRQFVDFATDIETDIQEFRNAAERILPVPHQITEAEHSDETRGCHQTPSAKNKDLTMNNTPGTPELTEDTRTVSTYIAMVVRNAMEDFHCEHLSDEQMEELNPIIRNAICTALHTFNNYQHVDAAKRFMDDHLRMVPSYWEPPTLQDGYVRMSERDSNG